MEISFKSKFLTEFIKKAILLCHSYLCTEQLIPLRSLAAQIVQRYVSAVRYTNVNGIVL